MAKIILHTPIKDEDIKNLKIGDIVYLTGHITTCRDVAHRRLIEEKRELPVDLKGGAIFHAGPIVRPIAGEKDRFEMVSIGPTTSMRMEKFEKAFIKETGVKLIVGKGGMGEGTQEACKEDTCIFCVFPAGCAVVSAVNFKQIIDRKINVMKEEGVKFITGCNVGVDVKSAELLKEYDRVILCCGAKHARDIKAAGRDAEGIYFAVDYLSRNTKSLLDSNFKDNKFISAKGKNVVIIGGGDTGNDCVGTAIRQGAKSVTQLEMMPCPPAERAANNPWPEWPKVLKTDYGQEEAIACFGTDPRIYQTTVKEFHKDKNGKLNGLTIVRLESKVDEKTGRRNMVEVSGSEKKIPAELVLIAAGFLGTEEYIAKAFGVELNQRTNVATEPGTYATNVKNVFVAGDMHRGQSLVVWAIREGREVAHDVDTSLMGYSYLSVQ